MNITAEKPLTGFRILVVEDDAILAFDIMCCLRDAGAETLGPAASLKRALAMSQELPLSCGVFDVSLRNELVFPAAQVLRKRRAGIVFYTGYAGTAYLKREWPDAQILSKPSPSKQIVNAVNAACHAAGLHAP